MSKVICNVEECKNNNQKFCTKEFVFVKGGICGELVDINGQKKNPEYWVKEEYLKNSSKNI